MKVIITQKLYNKFGQDIAMGGRPAMTLKDVIINAILTPLKDDDEKKKIEKYGLFKKLMVAEDEIDLTSEEISLLKRVVGLLSPQLIAGQVHEMLEGKFDNSLFEALKEKTIAK